MENGNSIKEYINKCRLAGMRDEDIISELKKSGWQDSQIREAFLVSEDASFASANNHSDNNDLDNQNEEETRSSSNSYEPSVSFGQNQVAVENVQLKAYVSFRNIAFVLMVFSVISLIFGIMLLNMNLLPYRWESIFGLLAFCSMVIGLVLGAVYLILGRKVRGALYYSFLVLTVLCLLGISTLAIMATVLLNQEMNPYKSIEESSEKNIDYGKMDSCKMLDDTDLTGILEVSKINREKSKFGMNYCFYKDGQNKDNLKLNQITLGVVQSSTSEKAMKQFEVKKNSPGEINTQVILGLGKDAIWLQISKRLYVLVDDDTYIYLDLSHSEKNNDLETTKSLAQKVLEKIKEK